jgi:hypothetical protein
MRVLVTGGRGYSDWKLAKVTLDDLHEKAPITKIIHGGCRYKNDPPGKYRGADGMADRWAGIHHMKPEIYEADWSQGRSGGPRRNAIMLKESKPDICLAFPGGDGTADMVRKARAANVTVIEVKDEN